jgi:hypothetical protein
MWTNENRVGYNRGEGRHQFARIVFHGKRGELRQRYREGQEDQLGALGLAVNVSSCSGTSFTWMQRWPRSVPRALTCARRMWPGVAARVRPHKHARPLRLHPTRSGRPRRASTAPEPSDRGRRELKCGFGSVVTGPPVTTVKIDLWATADEYGRLC